MNCVHCGAENPTAGTTCILCGQELARPRATAPRPQPTVGPPSERPLPGVTAGYVGGAPPSLMGWSVSLTVLSTICAGGCVPLVFGVMAIVYASQANTKALLGQTEDAWRDYSQAKTWCWVTAGVWLLSLIFVVVLYGAMFLAALGDQSIFAP